MSSTATTRHLLAAGPSWRAVTDAAVAAAALGATLALLRHGGVLAATGSAEVDVIGLALASCSTIPLVVWRRSPLGIFVATAVASLLLALLGYPVDLIPGPTIALYLLAASRLPGPVAEPTVAIAVGLFVAYLLLVAVAHQRFPVSELLHTGLAWAVAWFAGENTRLRREQIADLRDRALRAERDVERERLLAVAEERARIARDLHDSAGHAISVIAVRAGAARLRHGQDPGRALPALAAIEQLARQTVEEIDRMVGTLRDDRPANEAVEAPAGLASLDTLIAHHRAAGLAVTLERSGAPRPIDGAADQAAYRILQEALTNAARHGTGKARIELLLDETAIALTVTNPVRTAGAPRIGGGHGLVGMRERANLLGGTLDAGLVDGEFRVRAEIPCTGQLP